jgi:hypothetical protein
MCHQYKSRPKDDLQQHDKYCSNICISNKKSRHAMFAWRLLKLQY